MEESTAFYYIHQHKSRKKEKSNIRLKQNMSVETPTSAKEHLNFLFQF